MATFTDHTADIERLRVPVNGKRNTQVNLVCADLLELHDRQSTSLDKWAAARGLVEDLIGHPLAENSI